MGADPRVEAYAAKTLLQDLGAPIDRLYFTDPSVSADTLNNQGGLKCRTKQVGNIVDLQGNAKGAVANATAPLMLEDQLTFL